MCLLISQQLKHDYCTDNWEKGTAGAQWFNCFGRDTENGGDSVSNFMENK